MFLRGENSPTFYNQFLKPRVRWYNKIFHFITAFLHFHMPKSVTDQVGNCLSNVLILLVSESVKINTALLSGDFPKGIVDRG